MTFQPSPSDLEARARAVHVASLVHISPAVGAQLAQRRHAALGRRSASRGAAWAWASALAASLLLVVGLQMRMPDAPGSGGPSKTAVLQGGGFEPSPDALLTEDPDMYLWLASVEAGPDVE